MEASGLSRRIPATRNAGTPALSTPKETRTMQEARRVLYHIVSGCAPRPEALDSATAARAVYAEYVPLRAAIGAEPGVTGGFLRRFTRAKGVKGPASTERVLAVSRAPTPIWS